MTTRIALIDECLVLNGCDPLGSELAPGAETHIAAFVGVKDLLLTCHPWTFSTFIRQLNRQVAPPGIHWAYSYELPAEMIGAPRAYYDSKDFRRPFTDLELFGEREVRTDAAALWCRFTKDTQPALWPGYFREVVKLLLRSDFALSIREDRVMRDRLREDAIGSPREMLQGGLLAAARGIHDQGKPCDVLFEDTSPLIDVRF